MEEIKIRFIKSKKSHKEKLLNLARSIFWPKKTNAFSSVLLGLVVAGLFSAVFYVFALPYTPGQTTDPSCLPTDANCTVTASIPYSGATTDVDLGSKTLTTTGAASLGSLALTTALTVANGGTGSSSLTAYALLAGGTTSTGALQQVSGVGTSGQVLTSNGAAALPTWQAASGGANAALSNLASVAVSAVLIPGTAGALDFGSGTKPWADIYLAGTSGTPGTNNFKITGVSTSSTRTVTIPDASGTMTLLGNNSTGSGSVVLATSPTFTTSAISPLFTNTSALSITTTGSNGNISLTPNGTGSVSITSGVTTGTTTSSALALNANSLTTGTGLYLASSTLTSGLLADLQVSGTAAAASQTALNILTAGANATNAITTYGAQISNIHTNATSGTNVALYLNASGATTANYGLIVNAGNVGIGTTSPSSLLTLEKDNITTTSTDAILLQNATASTVSVTSQYSPALHFVGQGWKSNATAANQQVEFVAEVQPFSAGAAAEARLVFRPTLNGSGANGISFCSGGAAAVQTGTFIVGLDGTGAYRCDNSTGFSGFGPVNASNAFGVYNNASEGENFNINGIGFGSTKQLMWFSGAAGNGTSGDTAIIRNGVGVLEINNGTTGQWGALKSGVRDAGTTTVTNGVTIGHQTSGTAAAGLGSGILFNIDSSTTADQNAAQIAALWTDATHATRTADLVFYTVNSAASLAEALRVKGNGSLVVTSANATGTTTSSALSVTDASLTTGTLGYLSSSAVTTGKLLDIATSGNTWTGNSTTSGLVNLASTSTAGTASDSDILLNIARSGTNSNTAHTAYGIYSAVTNTNATSGTNVAAYLSASGATTANYGLIVNAGRVGIGTAAPATLLHALATTEQLRLGYDTTNYTSFTTASNGDVTLATTSATTGGNINLTSAVTGDATILGSTGTLVLGGSGGTNNETLKLDFETNANKVSVSSGTGVTDIDLGSINLITSGTLTLGGSTAGTLVTRVKAGAATESDANGSLVVDSTNGRLYFRYGAAWHYVAQTAGSQIPADETTDPISGDQMKLGDFVLGMVSKTDDGRDAFGDGALHVKSVKWDTVKQQLLEELKGQLPANLSLASGAVSGIGNTSWIGSITSALSSLGISIQNGITAIKELAVEKLSVKTARIEKLEMVDKATGDIYCTWIENGEWQKVKGQCPADDQPVSNSANQGVQQNQPDPQTPSPAIQDQSVPVNQDQPVSVVPDQPSQQPSDSQTSSAPDVQDQPSQQAPPTDQPAGTDTSSSPPPPAAAAAAAVPVPVPEPVPVQ